MRLHGGSDGGSGKSQRRARPNPANVQYIRQMAAQKASHPQHILSRQHIRECAAAPENAISTETNSRPRYICGYVVCVFMINVRSYKRCTYMHHTRVDSIYYIPFGFAFVHCVYPSAVLF